MKKNPIIKKVYKVLEHTMLLLVLVNVGIALFQSSNKSINNIQDTAQAVSPKDTLQLQSLENKIEDEKCDVNKK